ncbi:MAG TPA: AAA family ATPase [Pyrinomonadaceae bacterium]|nr:AAA family ATPase [Pyrinomonadaceae bacterium]
MKESITIKNFGGLKDVTIPLNSINIFIGKQASGKSVTAKLIYFFKKIISNIMFDVIREKSRVESDGITLESFKDYFPEETWKDSSFYIKYEFSKEKIVIEKSKGKELTLKYSPKIQSLFTFAKELESNRKKEEDQTLWRFPSQVTFNNYYSFVEKELGKNASNEQRFVPAGRSYFANVKDSIFSILSTNQTIDPFLIKFGSDYDFLKRIFRRPNLKFDNRKDRLVSELVDKLIAEILVGKYVEEDNTDYIIHDDTRKISVSFSSSGQQETLPLLVVLKALARIIVYGNGITTYIEEPEAHLFPSAQKKIVELISAIYNNAGIPLQFVITTHSPYILTSFNNLLQAGQLLEKGVNKKKLFKIVPEFEILKCGELNAYAFADGGVKSLIDKETGLISADLLDQVSEEIAVQFDELLEL